MINHTGPYVSLLVCTEEVQALPLQFYELAEERQTLQRSPRSFKIIMTCRRDIHSCYARLFNRSASLEGTLFQL
jgi:hypothetical protein